MSTPDPLEDVDFLARSPHRVRVLEELRSGPRTRPDLHEETGISQPTLGRVLGALEDRDWVERRGREYALTGFGELLAGQFADLLDTVEVVQDLGDVARYLPTERMDFDLRAFADATVTRPTTNDVLAHVRRGEELLADADHLRVLTPSIFPRALEDAAEGSPPRHHEAIVTADAVAALERDPALVDVTRTLLERDGAEVLRYDGPVETIVAVVDDTAIIGSLDGDGLPRALVESRNEAVRSWADSELDRYREAATALTAEDLPA